ncbi:4'-phosphopantetheinyl transferase family protein [Rivularia sp. UHCC 0363]|uniref:4'-phosphopantetheinyl transferase family protein n=1 Tax=Rivularia sp. UHCC 0363 TaxID=3110244 RepID=UPI002B1ED820|nr:4'-phosphopantetheinyl transferase superfamily protein [Rivularia sp. UHCC 0363]MEA5592798.1 4'-phosphopantetheinyl transferase superfamily protein [Rivularia sp. UHCC 0363]
MWLKAPTDITDIKLLPNEVHIWRENLENVKPSLEYFTQILSEDELGRAKRFHFEQHRQRFIAGRGILRSILGRYLNIEPSKIRFDYEPRGKPFLDRNYHRNLGFNLSHSQNFALYAVTLNDSIGVDLECFNSTTDVVSLAQRFFLPSEFAAIKSAPQEQQQQLFFRYWTCKEAYLKATGTGLKDLQKVEISLTPEQPARLNVPGEWKLIEIKPFLNCAAAIAISSRDLQLKYWDFGS